MELYGCTIIARNYLPAARVLAKSFRAQNPAGKFTVLVVDDIHGDLDALAEPFDVLGLDDIGIDHDEALRMAAIYDVTELCTAVKPWLLRRLLDAGADAVAYLDPDIKVYAPLDEVIVAAMEHGIVLTPHVTRPMPRDGLSKSETEVLLSGIYNLGFVAVSHQAGDFLSFWQARLERECIADPQNMRFVDQRWVDFVPGLYPVHILRDTTYNVAYWNLDHRDLAFRDGVYLVDGRPLHFFHFSGYSPDKPYLLSKHQGQRPRILLSERPDVARICDEYGADLVANGHGTEPAPEYGFARLANGVTFDRFMRRLYRSELLAAERTGATLPANPLEPGNEAAFLRWLHEPDAERPDAHVGRYLRALYAGRPDLQAAFPDPDGASFAGFATWVHHEVASGRLHPALATLPAPRASTRTRLNLACQLGRVERRLSAVPVPGTANEQVRLNMAGAVRRLERAVATVPVPADAERARLNLTRSLGRLERRLAAVPVPGTGNERVRLNMARSLGRLERRLSRDRSMAPHPEPDPKAAHTNGAPGDGIRVAGYLTTESGVGELGRLALAAVNSAGIEVATYVETTALSRQNHPIERLEHDMAVNVVCVNADELPNFAKRVGPSFFSGHYTVGLWAWELEELPQKFATAFDYVDEVWALSRFAREAIARVSPKPVYAFPLPIVEPELDETVTRAELGLPGGFVFLFCFDLLSIFERKNPLGLIDAFCTAFQPAEGPLLVIKVVNGQLEPGSLERLKIAASERSDVIVIDRYLDPLVNAALMASCDCYVSLHRSEGFGLTLAEAMALGKPVIATGYSGNLDFMTAETSYLVPWSAGKVPVGCSPYPAGARWAEPDLEAAARAMRDVYEHPSKAAEVGRRARAHVLGAHGIGAGADFVKERFAYAQSRLQARQVAQAPEPGVVEHVPPSSLVEAAQHPRSLDVPSNHPRLSRQYRRAVFRALRSHDDHDRELHVKLAVAVEGASAELSRLKGASEELRADVHSLRAEAAEMAGSIQRALAEQRQRIDDQDASLGAQDKRLDAQGERLDAQDKRLDAQDKRLDAQDKRLDALDGRLGSTEQRLEDADRPERWRRIEDAAETARELHAIPYMSAPDVLVTTDDDGNEAIGYRKGTELGGGYATFEDVFRGSEPMIRDRLRRYLPLLTDQAPVLDIGSGRGELLDVLRDAGIACTGVDTDPSMVQRSKAKGHDVLEQDGVEYLSAEPEASLGAVCAFQVIEHLSPDALLTLLREAYRALRPDGVLVLETVNPYSVQAFKAFWTDVTHRNPIYPEALVVHCAEAGFEEAIVRFPNGKGDLATDRWAEGEYAVVARKLI